MPEIVNGIFIYGLISSLLLSSIIVSSLMINPRIWMQDLPKELQQKIPPKTKKEKQQTWYVMLPFMTIILLGPVFAITDYLGVIHPTSLNFVQCLILSYGMYFIFNLFDLLIIDWLLICTITPKFIQIPGITASDLKNYKKHGMDFIKGIFLIIIPSIISAFLGYLII